jgi:hypothetical protein
MKIRKTIKFKRLQKSTTAGNDSTSVPIEQTNEPNGHPFLTHSPARQHNPENAPGPRQLAAAATAAPRLVLPAGAALPPLLLLQDPRSQDPLPLHLPLLQALLPRRPPPAPNPSLPLPLPAPVAGAALPSAPVCATPKGPKVRWRPPRRCTDAPRRSARGCPAGAREEAASGVGHPPVVGHGLRSGE